MNHGRKMASPPPAEEMSPTETWLAFTAIPRPYRIIPLPRCLPGTDTPAGEVAIWPLRQEEQMAANAEADRFTKVLMKDPQRREEANLGYMHTYTNEVAIQVLYRACRDPKDMEAKNPRAAFPSPGLMRKEMSTDEIGVLFQNYCTVQYELGPIRAQLTPEEEETLIFRLQEGGSAFPFDTLSWEEQRTLLLSMASRLVSCWIAMSSAGLQPDVTTYVSEGKLAEVIAEEQDRQSKQTQESIATDVPPPPHVEAPGT